MLSNDKIGASGVSASDVFEYLLKHLQQERAGAAGKIEHRDARVVGKAIADAESVFQCVVYGTDNEVHNRRWGVIHAPALTHDGVVSLQVVLIEVDERITLE